MQAAVNKDNPCSHLLCALSVSDCRQCRQFQMGMKALEKLRGNIIVLKAQTLAEDFPYWNSEVEQPLEETRKGT